MKPGISTIIFLLLPHELLIDASTVIEPNTNGILCGCIKRLTTLRQAYDRRIQQESETPVNLQQGRRKIIQAIKKAENGIILGSMYLVKSSIEISNNIVATTSNADEENLSETATLQCRWVAMGFLDLVVQFDNVSNSMKQRATLMYNEGAQLLEEKKYKESVMKFIQVVRKIVLHSLLFADKVLEKPVCEDSSLESTRMPMTPRDTPNPFHGTWQNDGQELNGVRKFDEFGWSISLSKNGNVLAVASKESRFQSTKHPKSGYIRVYQRDVSSKQWKQMGQIMIGDGDKSISGAIAAMNGDGSILAARIGGQIKVHQYNMVTLQWDVLGDAVALSSNTLSLSESGLILAIEYSGKQRNKVQVFRLEEHKHTKSWQQLGQTIKYIPSEYSRGSYILLSDSGMSFGVGSSVYQYSSASARWILMGGQVGEGGWWTMAMSGNGQVVAARKQYDRISTTSRYYVNTVSVFAFDESNSTWLRRGQKLGVSPRYYGDFGRTLSLNSDGNILAVGVFDEPPVCHRERDDCEPDLDMVRIFQYDAANTREWIQLGQTITNYGGDLFSYSISLSGNGTEIAIGAPWENVDHKKYSGHVSVYTLSD